VRHPLGRTSRIALPLLGAASILLLWQFAVPALGVPTFIVPTPAAVAVKFLGEWRFLLTNALPTVLESVLGFLFGKTAWRSSWP
jgi:NitT/TauT family transport system permease protein